MPKTYIGAGGTPASSTANVTDFWCLGGRLTRNATETNVSILFRSAGTLSNLYVRLTVNTTTAGSTFRTRKNAGNGGQSVSIGIGATGEFQDSSGTDTVVAGDKLCYSWVPGGATGAPTFSVQSVIFNATTNSVTRLITNYNVTLATASTTWYSPLGGNADSAVTVETQAKQDSENQEL